MSIYATNGWSGKLSSERDETVCNCVFNEYYSYVVQKVQLDSKQNPNRWIKRHRWLHKPLRQWKTPAMNYSNFKPLPPRCHIHVQCGQIILNLPWLSFNLFLQMAKSNWLRKWIEKIDAHIYTWCIILYAIHKYIRIRLSVCVDMSFLLWNVTTTTRIKVSSITQIAIVDYCKRRRQQPWHTYHTCIMAMKTINKCTSLR